MAFTLADRVRETASAPGTGTVTLLGAVTGYQSFSAGIGANNTTYYVIADQNGGNWEVGLGTIGAGGTTLARTTVLSSSNSGSLVNFASGTQDVFCDYPASKSVSTDYTNALGVVTPNTGTFTTITGQTEVLKGTGQNLLTYSQQIGGTNWSAQGTASVVLNNAFAPDVTTTASTITLASGGYYRQITLAPNRILSGVNYTFSCYVKASASSGASNVRLTTNNTVAWNTGFSTKFALTSSWQRVSVTGTITGTDAYFIIGAIDATGTNDATCAGNVDVWGAQFELGSVANTYIATTASVVYGSPTLSFSGVATIGLEQNGSLYVSPAGTGALQAQATTSSTVGGNARGANAVDWQTSRNNANQVASGAGSVIGGGINNLASTFYSGIFSGATNTNSNNYCFIGGGANNSITGSVDSYSAIVSGYSNSALGRFNFIGGGYANSGTATAAVTTQSGTMNATTAVTLSGSNANIKVGQLVTGTSINSFPPTYVAAISGTSLTLSQNASGSSTSTLSFFTPHGVVVGGGNNQATGSYSFIGGGGDAGTAGNRNTASGDWSTVGGGQKIIASGSYSSVLGGSDCSATNSYAVCLGGAGNAASGFGATNLGGNGNNANGTYSIAGGFSSTNRSIPSLAFSAGRTSSNGDAQTEIFVLRNATTDATATVLTTNAGAAGTTNQVILPNNSAYLFKATVISGVTGAGNTSAWKLEGAIKRGATAGSTAIVGTVTTTLLAQDVGAATWAVTATADTTNGGLKITVTGQAATTIRWVCKVETTEMTF